jgi:hypothetical protein
MVFWMQASGERWQLVAKQKNPKNGFASFAELWLASADGQGLAGMPGFPSGGPGQLMPRMVPPGGPQPAQAPPLPPRPDKK